MRATKLGLRISLIDLAIFIEYLLYANTGDITVNMIDTVPVLIKFRDARALPTLP